MVFAALAFTLMISAVKVGRDELSTFDLMVWRAALAVPLAALMGMRTKLSLVNVRLFFVRLGCGFVGMMGFFTAAKGLLVADLSILGKLQPILIALGAPILLGTGERVSRPVWVALAIGLLGTAILVGPQLAIGVQYGLWALLAAVASALAHIAVRKLGETETPIALVFWFQLGLLPLAVVANLLVHGRVVQWPSARLWPFVLAVGVCSTVGQWFMTRAYTLDRAASVAAASYVGPLWAVLIDVLLFGTWPAPVALVGGGLVLSAGLMLVFRPSEASA